jgi:hypothetical protein
VRPDDNDGSSGAQALHLARPDCRSTTPQMKYRSNSIALELPPSSQRRTQPPAPAGIRLPLYRNGCCDSSNVLQVHEAPQPTVRAANEVPRPSQPTPFIGCVQARASAPCVTPRNLARFAREPWRAASCAAFAEFARPCADAPLRPTLPPHPLSRPFPEHLLPGERRRPARIP